MSTDLINNIEEAGSIRINQMVYEKRRRGEEVLVLSLGEAFFDIPMFSWDKIDFVQGYHYSDSLGLPGLRKKLSSYYSSRYGFAPQPDKQILISTGSKVCVYMGILASINPGDEVLIQEPYWLSYPEQVKLCRGIPKVIPYWEKSSNFKKYFTSKTKLVILNNPNNPAGSVYSREDLGVIYDICRSVDANLMVDEAYSDFCLNREFVTAGVLDPELKNLLIVNSLSKNMGMSGWRLGYLFAHEKMIRDVLKLNQHFVTCAPTVLQQYTEAYFDEILEHTLPQVRAVVEKRKRVAGFMDSIGLKYLPGATTFYFFVDISTSGRKSAEFAEWLLKEHAIAVVPGICYGESTDKFVRVGVGTESEARLSQALKTIRAAL